jgi:hypothetical protein
MTRKPLVLDFSPLDNIKATTPLQALCRATIKPLEIDFTPLRSIGAKKQEKTRYKGYSKILNEAFIIDTQEGGIRFDNGAYYSKEEIAIISTATNETKQRLHQIKTLFENSEIVNNPLSR